jgi:hypothetical protein
MTLKETQKRLLKNAQLSATGGDIFDQPYKQLPFQHTVSQD